MTRRQHLAHIIAREVRSLAAAAAQQCLADLPARKQPADADERMIKFDALAVHLATPALTALSELVAE
jgi:hypothetical protein